MAVTINSNVTALRTLRALSRSSGEAYASFERLSSGLRINRASDDAAGLAIASTLDTSGRVYTQALRNLNDAISVHAIAEGATSQLKNVLIRLEELAISSANGTYSLSQRRSNDREADALVEEFNRILHSTDFNGRKLLDGALGRLVIQAGFGSNELLDLGLASELRRTVGTGTFGSAINFNGGTDAVEAADVDGDGDLDLVGILSGLGTGTTTLRLNDGSGNFSAQAQIENFGAGSTRNAHRLADMNNDGRIDIVTSGEGGLFVQLGNGDGTFQAATATDIGGIGTTLEIADFDGDGNLDAVSAYAFTVQVLKGDGAGGMSINATFAGPNGPLSGGIGDINGDGQADIIVNGARFIHAYFGGANGSFSSGTSIYSNPGGSGLTDLRVEDMDDDGVDEIVVFDTADDGIKILKYQLGSGQLGLSSFIANGLGLSGLNVADFNGDGIMDILGSGAGSGVLLGNASGGYDIGAFYGGSQYPLGRPAFGDFNGDGAPDLVVPGAVHLANTSQITDIETLNINSRQHALDSLAVIDAARSRVTALTGALGSNQSRLLSALNAISARRENYEAAEGRIKNADVAAESASLVRASILQQTAASVLAQANQLPTLALELLALGEPR